jgi:hypothetical protein
MRSYAIAAPDAKAGACGQVDVAACVQHGEERWQQALHGCLVGCVFDEVAVDTLRDCVVAVESLADIDQPGYRQMRRGEAHGPLVLEKIFVAGAEASDEFAAVRAAKVERP